MRNGGGKTLLNGQPRVTSSRETRNSWENRRVERAIYPRQHKLIFLNPFIIFRIRNRWRWSVTFFGGRSRNSGWWAGAGAINKGHKFSASKDRNNLSKPTRIVVYRDEVGNTWEIRIRKGSSRSRRSHDRKSRKKIMKGGTVSLRLLIPWKRVLRKLFSFIQISESYMFTRWWFYMGGLEYQKSFWVVQDRHYDNTTIN